MISFYFTLGKEISESSFKKEYGSKFYINLSNELKKLLPNTVGFSPRNLSYIESFYILYRKILQQVVAKFEISQQKLLTTDDLLLSQTVIEKLVMIPWGHHCIIIDSCKDDPKKAWFYINKTIINNWSRSLLANFIKGELYEREGKGINNFDVTLPDINKTSCSQLAKDPYYFDFGELRADYDEKALKKTLVDHVRELLIELGKGFSFVDQEYRIHVGQSDFYIDLLFYHIPLHRYVVVEVKTTKFKPEFLGQLNFYVTAINKDIKGEKDDNTIGLLICRDKDGDVVRYSIENYDIPLGVSSYELSRLIEEKCKEDLPTIEEVETEKDNQ